nr:DNA translocase FtsK [Entomomonas asaccharolytica]
MLSLSFWRQQAIARSLEVLLIFLVLVGVYWLLTLLTCSPNDPTFNKTASYIEISNIGGITGAKTASLCFFLFGYIAYLLPILLIAKSIQIFYHRKQINIKNFWLLGYRFFGLLLIVFSACILAHQHFATNSILQAVGIASGGGIIGDSIGTLFLSSLSNQLSTLISLLCFCIGLTVFLKFSWLTLVDFVGKFTIDLYELLAIKLNQWWQKRSDKKQIRRNLRDVDEQINEVVAPVVADKQEQQKIRENLIKRQESLANYMSKQEERPAVKVNKPTPTKTAEPSKRVLKEKQAPLFEDTGDPLPPFSLLDPAEKKQRSFSAESLEAMSRLLEIKLKEFGVEVTVVDVHPGPVITRFEIELAPGIKVSRISNLAKDLARSLAVLSVRVVEVIPGKTTVGIEIPNEDRQIVRLSEVITSEAYDQQKSPVTLALGQDIGGEPVITDLAKMPHLLVAGTTGSGKSVGVNAMILSILFKSTPEQARLIMIDPKMLELSIYEGIPHLLCPVVTDMKEAANSLRWCVAEMERRYKLMAKMGVRNIAGYNRKIKDALEAGEGIEDPLYKRESVDDEPPLLKHLPIIVVVVDEFADMMMIVGKKVEELIARIAQKARAAGIHLILATQRPSVDVITGLIKANIPTRMAFQVSSKIDSRTILDQGGAEQLLGHGDMLYLPPGTGLPIRVHGAFVSDDEVHRVVEAWKQRGEPDYEEAILNGIEESIGYSDSNGDSGSSEDDDPLYDEAVRFVTESRRASISSVQRKLKIGYNRAARMIEAMEDAGVVTAMSSNGSREVLAPPPVRD